MASSIRSPDQQPTRQRYVVMAFLCVLAFLSYFDRVCMVKAQSAVQNELGLTDRQIGLVLGVFWFAYALFDIPGGWMGDRYGARITLTRIVVAWSVFTILSGCATGFAFLFLCRFLFGVGEAGAFPNMARVQANWLPPRARARSSGLLWSIARWGGASAPLLFGMLLDYYDSWGRLVRGILLVVSGYPRYPPSCECRGIAAHSR
jgi:MFS transporter, ACS family, glucarate transporter